MVFLDVETERKPNDREAAEQIKALGHLTAATEFSLLPMDVQSRYLRQLQQERYSIRQLARLTGLSKGQIERMIK